MKRLAAFTSVLGMGVLAIGWQVGWAAEPPLGEARISVAEKGAGRIREGPGLSPEPEGKDSIDPQSTLRQAQGLVVSSAEGPRV